MAQILFPMPIINDFFISLKVVLCGKYFIAFLPMYFLPPLLYAIREFRKIPVSLIITELSNSSFKYSFDIR